MQSVRFLSHAITHPLRKMSIVLSEEEYRNVPKVTISLMAK